MRYLGGRIFVRCFGGENVTIERVPVVGRSYEHY